MWGLGKQDTHPVAAQSMGGRFTYDDGADTPNTQVATMQYDDGKMLVFEVRGRATNKEWDIRVGNLFYGSKGYMAIRGYGFETVVDGQPGPSSGEEQSNEWDNFHDAVRSGRREDLNAEIAKGHHAATLCHLANIAYRTGRTLSFDPKTEHFVHDREANGYLTRNYRTGFVMPDVV
jgi:hypothetical protein